MGKKVYRCRDDVTREFLTDVMVMNARSPLEKIIDALYWRERSMTRDIIIPNRGTISSMKNGILRGKPSAWMLREIMKKPYLLRRYSELQAERRLREQIVHRTL